MAALFLTAKEMHSISSLSGVINEKLVEFLCSQDSGNHAEIAKQITAGFTKAALIEARRKIFEVAICKEKEKSSLATEWYDESTFETDERTSIDPMCLKELRLVNRSTKPKLAEDIMQIASYIDDPEIDFPMCTVRSVATKEKAVSDKGKIRENPTSPHAHNSDPVENPGSATGDRNSSAAKSSESSAPIANLNDRFERFVIRETSSSIIVGTEEVSATVSELRDYSEATTGIISFRSFATQTDCVVLEPIRDRSRPTSQVIQVCSDVLDTIETDLPNITSTESTVTRSVTSHSEDRIEDGDEEPGTKTPGNRESTDPANTDTHENHSTPSEPSDSTNSQSNQLDSSLFDYIEEEYQSLKDKLPDMCASKRVSTSDRNNDKRIASLEAKVDRVVKRLEYVEKDHTKEICEIRAELRMIAYANPDMLRADTPYEKYNSTRSGRRDRRHSSGDVTSPSVRLTDSLVSEHPDDSVWDVNPSDPMVYTQDSQGKTIPTKATPLHRREMDSVKQTSSVQRTGPPETCDKNAQPNLRNVDASNIPDGRRDIQPTIPSIFRQNATETGAEPSVRSTKGLTTTTRRNEQPGAKQTSANRNAAASNVESPDIEPNAAKKRKTYAGYTPPDPVPSTSKDQPEQRQRNTGNAQNRNVAPQSSDDSSKDKNSYSGMVTKYPWKTQGKDKGKKRALPTISGLDDSENKELFVRGLKCADFRSKKDLEDSVKHYCKEREVNLVHQRVLGFKAGRVTVGCKVVVKNADVDKISMKGFWPAKVWIREWYDDPPSDIENFSGNDSSPSHDSD